MNHRSSWVMSPPFKFGSSAMGTSWVHNTTSRDDKTKSIFSVKNETFVSRPAGDLEIKSRGSMSSSTTVSGFTSTNSLNSPTALFKIPAPTPPLPNTGSSQLEISALEQDHLPYQTTVQENRNPKSSLPLLPKPVVSAPDNNTHPILVKADLGMDKQNRRSKEASSAVSSRLSPVHLPDPSFHSMRADRGILQPPVRTVDSESMSNLLLLLSLAC
jgi:hypothetical protein